MHPAKLRRMTLFADAASESGDLIELPDGELCYYPRIDFGADPQALFETLRSDLQWREGDVVLYGKRYRQPRLFAWYGEENVSYRYSGTRYEPLPWTSSLSDLRARVQALTGASFNSVLANYYRDHNDSMGLHADDEAELGAEPVIASLSLGEERVFRLKHRLRRDLKPFRLTLPSGSLLVMSGKTQQYWKHEVPKSRVPCGPRINLTFRQVHGA